MTIIGEGEKEKVDIVMGKMFQPPTYVTIVSGTGCFFNDAVTRFVHHNERMVFVLDREDGDDHFICVLFC